jgi:alpha-galactosidase
MRAGLALIAVVLGVFAAPAGAAPPMGWNSWNHFHCDVSEQVVEQTADAIVASGLRDAGYRYVNVDDCWEAASRDADGRLQSDPKTFPSGIAALAGYVHARGLKLGIYTAAGATTCQGRPGSGGSYALDAATFAAWGVDYVKFDWCGAKGVPHDLTAEFRAALNATGRRIVLGVSRHGSPWLWDDHPADLWRTSADIDDTWNTMLRNAEEEAGLSGRAGHGKGWNDPDMLQVGNGGMSADEYRAHFSLWALLAAPLLMGNDVREMSQDTRAILGNREVIAVDQDPLGRPGDRVFSDGNREVWTRPLAGGDVAVVLFNRGPYSTEIRARGVAGRARDLWAHRDFAARAGISAFVPPHGVAMYRVSRGGHGGAPLRTLSARPGFLEAGRTTVVKAALSSGHGRIALHGPPGWTIRPRGSRFLVTVPAGTPPGTAALKLSGGGVGSDYVVVIPPPPPSATGALSDHPAVQADNGWYLPLKVDHSFGDDFCGDCTGGTLTLSDGRTYATGLGTHASSQVDYYLGGACRTFAVDVGIDAEIAGMTWPRPQNIVGTARFWIYADGRLVYAGGVRSLDTRPGYARLDVRGVDELKLVNDSAADGNFLDHADWAGMLAACGS